ncbi:ABC transporter substrate-binding protein [Dongia sedimenti]|uniref:ABC transporter substrate-binding protein n=1 Tax=Dongia sedimenti TaxID=3064282 RepID=A0ABU0YQ51_9PROT|nr:ABC transporter substrate-binding protein [Rhodospirillaceae bacterium R-7]
MLKFLGKLVAFGAIALAVVAPIQPAAASGQRPDITIAVADIPPTLEPGKEMSNVGTRTTYSIFDTLIRRDFLSQAGGSGAALKPGLAESWKRVDDQTLEVKLRPNVHFHNGAVLTADDVVFTFSEQRLRGKDAPLPEGRAYFSVFDQIEAVDPLTVRFHAKQPDPLMEQRLSSWASWIVNKADWLEKAKDGKIPQFPVGTGPYKLEKYQASDSIRLVAFDDYFGGRPTAASITFRKVPEQAARIAGLVSGEFDIITNVSPDQIDQINGYDNIEARSVVLANSHVIVYNTTNPLLADKRMRQALSLSIDRQLLVDSLWNGKAIVPHGHQYPEFGDMYDPSRPQPAYDPEKAKALLKEVGYKGETITYASEPSYYLNALPAAQAMIEMWKKVGINVELKVVENLDKIPLDQLMIRNWSNSTRYPDPLGAICVTWGPYGSAQKTWKSWQEPNSTAFNNLCKGLEGTLDQKKRFALEKQLLDTWEDEAPGTLLYQPLETYGVRKTVKWQPYTFYYMDLRPDNLAFE